MKYQTGDYIIIDGLEDSVFQIIKINSIPTDGDSAFTYHTYHTKALGGIYAPVGDIVLTEKDIVRKATCEEVLVFEVISK